MTVTILCGDCREVLRGMPAESVHCVVTSPPYWGMRDYDVAGQLGLEPTYQEYVVNMVEVCHPDRTESGICWNGGALMVTSNCDRRSQMAKRKLRLVATNIEELKDELEDVESRHIAEVRASDELRRKLFAVWGAVVVTLIWSWMYWYTGVVG